MTLTATAAATSRPAFWSHGACVDLPADWFHPERGESTKEAKGVCSACAVRVDCLGYALGTYQRFGIWGGTSERERRRIRRRLDRGEPVPELDRAPDDDRTDPDPIIITLEEEPAVELTIATSPAPAPTNGASTRACAHCGKAYAPVRRDQRFHSKECARAWYSSHPKGKSGKRERRTRKPRPIEVPVARKAPATHSATGPTPDLQSLLGQLLAGCDQWHVEATLGDVHVTVSRDASR